MTEEIDYESGLNTVKERLIAVGSRIPKETMRFPEAPEMKTRELLISQIQIWMNAINLLEEIDEDLIQIQMVINTNLSALKLKKTLLQSMSELPSERSFNRYFLKNHWHIYRAIHGWEEAKKACQSLMDTTDIKKKKTDRCIQTLRTINKSFGDLNINQMVYEVEQKRSEQSKVQSHTEIFTVESVANVEVLRNDKK